MSIITLVFDDDSEKSDTEFHEAVAANDLQKVKDLIAEGVDIHHIGDWGCTPLEYAIELGFLDIVSVLLSAGANPEFGVNIYPLSLAVQTRQVDIVSALIEAGADVNQDLEHSHTVLMEASIAGDFDIVRLLVEMGADVNLVREDGATALMCAALSGWQDIFKYLALLTSPQLREQATQKLPSGLIYRQRKESKLTEDFIFASGQGQIDAVREAILKGVNVNAFDSFGNTALCFAAYWGQLDTVRFLLQVGANLELKDEQNGWTPLIAAIRLGQVEVVKLLIKAGANVHSTHRCQTTLMFAINYAIKNINFGNRLFSKTSFHHFEVIQVLIEAGVDVNAKDELGRTALILADYQKKTEIVELLRGAGATEN